MIDIDRRALLSGLAATAFAGGCTSGQTSGVGGSITSQSASLKALAAAKGIKFGSAMATHQIDNLDYAAIMRRECAVMVAENAHKMYAIQSERHKMNWEGADSLVRFAKENQIAMRGHTLVWHHPRWMPEWVNEAKFSTAEAETVLGEYIAKVAGRYDPFIYSWDVVNESVDDQSGELRETSFSKAMGGTINTLDFCFRKAKEAAPNCSLAYNDYMSWESTSAKHRDGVLRLVEALKAKGTPIDAVGMQSHSNYEMPNQYDRKRERDWVAFLDELKGMGIERFYITEFDVNDTRMSADIETRDRAIASYTKDYLDLMLSYTETKDVLMWGMVDSMSWLQNFMPRDDGVEKRPTLYDNRYEPKAMREAVAAALRDAPARS